MSDDKSPYKHDDSDRKLDKSADEADTAGKSAKSGSHAGHDPKEIAKHDDSGKDRMFEGREQRDDADMKSEKNRLSKDQDRHKHDADDTEAVTESNMHVKRKD